MTHPHRAPELRPPCAPGTLARPTRAGRARSGTDGVGRAPPRRAATGDIGQEQRGDEEMPKMVFVALQIFHTVLPARSKYLGFSAQPPSCGARHERGRAITTESRWLRPRRSARRAPSQHGDAASCQHTTSAAAACRRAHAGGVLDDCSARPDWGLRGVVTDGHGAGWQATALRRQEKRGTGIPVLGLS